MKRREEFSQYRPFLTCLLGGEYTDLALSSRQCHSHHPVLASDLRPPGSCLYWHRPPGLRGDHDHPAVALDNCLSPTLFTKGERANGWVTTPDLARIRCLVGLHVR